MSRVFTPAALVGAAAILLAPTPPAVASTRTFSTGVVVVSDSGGQGVIAADLLEAAGIGVPVLDPSTQAALRRFVPWHAGVANPVDLAGAGEADLANYARAVVAVAADPATSAVLLTGYFGKYGVDSQELAAREGEVADELVAVAAERSVLIHSMAATGPTADRLRRAGLPVFDTIEAATSALAGARIRRRIWPCVRNQPTVPQRHRASHRVGPRITRRCGRLWRAVVSDSRRR
jgi:acyl-CoA synthetase (NDP forming)